MKITKCKGCGADIFFIRTKKGKLAPISIASMEKRYILTRGDPDQEGKIVDTYLPHHADCPEVDQFRKPPKRPDPPPHGEDIKSS